MLGGNAWGEGLGKKEEDVNRFTQYEKRERKKREERYWFLFLLSGKPNKGKAPKRASYGEKGR